VTRQIEDLSKSSTANNVLRITAASNEALNKVTTVEATISNLKSSQTEVCFTFLWLHESSFAPVCV
jgi:beta-lactam-binding protein with PASTA domain